MVSAAALRAFALVSAVKLALVPCYRSTDFEVHRNWLAVTGTLPMREWYVDATSEWTLDYPPLFAHFERFLAVFARIADPEMLTVQAAPYASFACVVFQRCSVIAADVVLALGAFRAANVATRPNAVAVNERGRGVKRTTNDDANDEPSSVALAALFVLFNPGLLLVDHVHFQYNGVALGLQLCAVAAANEGAPLLAAFLFSVLVHFKHIFAYAAPAFAAHLIAHHTPIPRTRRARRKRGATRDVAARLAAFAGVAAGVTAVSLGPFAAFGQLAIVAGRLFPFGRGLSHAYWAPNAWALYNAADKVAAKALRVQSPVAHLARGMTGHGGTGAATHVALPAVSPRVTFFLTLAACAPGLYAHTVARTTSLRPSALPRLVAYVSLCAFAFGWHVHEKAALMVSAPLGVAAALDAADAAVSPDAFAKSAGAFLFMTVTSTYALVPLLFEPREWPIKVAALALWSVAALGAARDAAAKKLKKNAPPRGASPSRPARILTASQTAYLFVLLPLVEMYVGFAHERVFGKDRLAFLPLALVSVTCALGVCAAWAEQARAYAAESFRAPKAR
jgi:alpha-1,3-glucosyltransferase